MSSAFGVADVDLVLGRADLVVVVLDRDAHRLERADRVAAYAGRGVERRLREVAALVERLRPLLVLEEEVLRLGADVERVEAHRLHPLERAPEREARVAGVRLAVGRDDVADHPRRLAVGQHPEGLGVGDRDHVRLLDRVEAGDRRAVEAHPVVERALDLADRDREALEMPLEIGEPEEHVLDAAGLDLREHLLARLRIDVARFLLSTYAILPPVEREKPRQPPCCGGRGSVASQLSPEILHVVRTDGRYPHWRPRPARSSPCSARGRRRRCSRRRRTRRARRRPQYVAPAGSGALFLVSGHGYGHGVGMGQWGAQGYAQQGYTDEQILAAYYPGTDARRRRPRPRSASCSRAGRRS